MLFEKLLFEPQRLGDYENNICRKYATSAGSMWDVLKPFRHLLGPCNRGYFISSPISGFVLFFRLFYIVLKVIVKIHVWSILAINLNIALYYHLRKIMLCVKYIKCQTKHIKSYSILYSCCIINSFEVTYFK